MISIGAGQGQASPLPSLQAAVGKTPVGLESSQSKASALPPIEQSAAAEKARSDQAAERNPAATTQSNQAATATGASKSASDTRQADQAQQVQVRELANTDRKVQAHEAAHAGVAGALAGSKSFTYVTGPDGVRYAVGGEVSISFGEVPGDPEATLRNALQVRAAALAPADPSGQDYQVAAQAAQLAQQARQDLAAQRAETQSPNANRQRANSAIRAFSQVQREPAEAVSLLDQRA
ncbi:MAG: hypothetical protein JWM78_1397 [Verrucomicrobiaceae bacterium]|nr:hypothetical protein [Verrucomicrobiaceae bacterium]